MKYYFTSRLGETRYRLADGSLLCKNVPIARTGVQLYSAADLPDIEPDDDGDILVTRRPEQVFSAEAVASFEGVPVVILHPTAPDGELIFVDPANWKVLAEGHIQNVRRGSGEQSDLLLADLLIKSEAAIGAIDAGLRDISCGYDADYVQTARGAADQINIVGNHTALVPDGRAGKRCSIGDSNTMAKTNSWFYRLKKAIKTGDSADAAALLENAPETLTADDDTPDNPTLVLKVEGAAPDPALTGNDDDSNIGARLTALEALIKSLVEKDTPAPTGDESTAEDDDEEETKRLTGDAGYQQNVAARAELILPGFTLPASAKPGSVKRQVLSAACKTADGQALIGPLAGGVTDFSKTPIATVDSIFNSASELAKMRNNVSQNITALGITANATTITDINKQTRDFWAKKGAK